MDDHACERVADVGRAPNQACGFIVSGRRSSREVRKRPEIGSLHMLNLVQDGDKIVALDGGRAGRMAVTFQLYQQSISQLLLSLIKCPPRTTGGP